MRFLALLLFALSANAAVIDYGPPQDSQGHWLFDLYDSSNNQRGTSLNPFYINSSVTIPSGSRRTPIQLARNVYSTTNVTTTAYVSLITTSSAINSIDIFDSSGQTLVLSTGASGSQVDKMYIVPGGNGRVDISIPTSTQVWLKAVSANATVGEFNATFYQ